MPKILQKVDLPIIPFAECNTFVQKLADESNEKNPLAESSNVCVGHLDQAGQGACNVSSVVFPPVSESVCLSSSLKLNKQSVLLLPGRQRWPPDPGRGRRGHRHRRHLLGLLPLPGIHRPVRVHQGLVLRPLDQREDRHHPLNAARQLLIPKLHTKYTYAPNVLVFIDTILFQIRSISSTARAGGQVLLTVLKHRPNLGEVTLTVPASIRHKCADEVRHWALQRDASHFTISFINSTQITSRAREKKNYIHALITGN